MGLLSRIEDIGGGLLGLGRGSVGRMPPTYPVGTPPIAPTPHAQPSGPSFLRILDDVLGGKTISQSRDDWQTRQANAPLLEAERAAKLAQYQRQQAAYGVLDKLPNLTPEEQVAAAFAPAKLGEAYASGSDAYTLGRNDQRYFRNGQVNANTTAPDPQVVAGRLIGPTGEVIYEPPQYEKVGTDTRLVQTSPGVGGAAPAPSAAPSASPSALPADPAQVVASLTSMGARLTSGRRSPADNARVGGVPRSDHLTGQAADLVPPAGMTLAQLGEEARRRIPGAQVLEEGDHVHIEWGAGAHHGAAPAPQASGGPRVVVEADPKAGKPPVVVPPGVNLKDLGNGWFQDPVGRLYQPDSSGKLVQTAGVTDEAVKRATEAVGGINNLIAATVRYEQAIKALSPRDFGPSGQYTGDPRKFATAKAAATNLQMLAKGPEMYALGVLAGPDVEVLSGVIEDPSKWGALIRQNQIVPKLHEFARGVGTKYEMTMQGFKAQGGNPNGLPELYGNRRVNGTYVTNGTTPRQAPAASAPGQAAPQNRGTAVKTKNGETVHVGAPI